MFGVGCREGRRRGLIARDSPLIAKLICQPDWLSTLAQDNTLLLRCWRYQQTKDRRQAEAVSAALERRRIAKRQAAARAERQRKAAISIALNEKRKEKLKVCQLP